MFEGKKIVASVEARMNSSRLPGKVLMEISGRPVLEILVSRLSESKYIDEIIIATTASKDDDEIEKLCKRLNIKVYRGSEDDVLGRVVEAVESVNGDIIIEITGDCPLIDAEVVDYVVEDFLRNFPEYDYVTNIGYVDDNEREIAVGMDVRVFTFAELKKISEITNDKEDREHVSLYFFRGGKDRYNLHNVEIPRKWKRDFIPRLTLDTKEDFDVIKNIYESLSISKINFDLEDILNYLDTHREITEINSSIVQKKVSGLG